MRHRSRELQSVTALADYFLYPCTLKRISLVSCPVPNLSFGSPWKSLWVSENPYLCLWGSYSNLPCWYTLRFVKCIKILADLFCLQLGLQLSPHSEEVNWHMVSSHCWRKLSLFGTWLLAWKKIIILVSYDLPILREDATFSCCFLQPKQKQNILF